MCCTPREANSHSSGTTRAGPAAGNSCHVFTGDHIVEFFFYKAANVTEKQTLFHEPFKASIFWGCLLLPCPFLSPVDCHLRCSFGYAILISSQKLLGASCQEAAYASHKLLLSPHLVYSHSSVPVALGQCGGHFSFPSNISNWRETIPGLHLSFPALKCFKKSCRIAVGLGICSRVL